MKNYKQYVISQNGVELGLAWNDIQEHLLTPSQYKSFEQYMQGQTCGVLVCYTGDYLRFIKGLPVID